MLQNSFNIHTQFVDISAKAIFPAIISVVDGRIATIQKLTTSADQLPFLLPGFVDAHVHIESSMLVPSEFARMAVVHGTVGTISDPHEIANVCGIEGVNFMIDNGNTVPFKFHFGAPSCVPATSFETAGATIDVEDVKALLARPEINYLSEMMNFPGVLHGDPEVMQKIAAAKAAGKPVDGHAPGLRGDAARQYIAAGISTDHECFTEDEALDKLRAGMKILIREGSAAKNFEALIPLLADYPDMIMFCSDDKHPDSLELGHINQLCARAVAKGIDVFQVLQAACINPVQHYAMRIGQLQVGDPADFITVSDLTGFQVTGTWINGVQVAKDGQSLIRTEKAGMINNFDCEPVTAEDLLVPYTTEQIPVIGALDGQLVTEKLTATAKQIDGQVVSDPENDILKIVVVNRYNRAPIAKSFIKNFGLKAGAMASSVAHDSHNIVAVGVDDDSLARAINLVRREKGGVSAVHDTREEIVSLPVAGLMSNEDGYAVSRAYTAIDQMTRDMGSTLGAPFMTLSFMALLVIPHLKLSDKGLFDGDSFSLIN